MTLPNLTDEQRAAALEKAAEARKVRADFKKQISTRELPAAKAITKALTDDTLSKMKVEQFFRALPSIGPAKAKTLLAQLEISETRRLRGLGKTQLAEVTALCQRIDKGNAAVAA